MREIHILITRAMPQALRTAQAVEDLKLRPVLLPLTEIVPLDARPPFPVGFESLIASSANAFTMLKERKNWHAFRARPLFCVGQQTAHAAKQAGFTHIAAIADDAENLTNILKNNKIKNFLYLAGRYRRPLLEESLQKQGKDITIVEIYDQRPIMPDITRYHTLPAPVDYVLLYSALAAKQLSNIMLAHLFAKTTKFLCLSARIAKALPQDYAAHSRAFFSDSGSEECSRLLFLTRFLSENRFPLFRKRSIIARNPSESSLLASLKQDIQSGKRL